MAGYRGISRRLARAGVALASPPMVAAVVLLLVNDRWWKAAWPGLVTGKLSDVAGVITAAVLVSVVAVVAGAPERAAARGAVVVVAAGFVAMKTSAGGAHAAEGAWAALNRGHNVVVADRTDLIALVALPLVPWIWRRWGGDHVERLAPAVRRSPSRLLRGLAALAVFGTGTMATTATSCADNDGVRAVVRVGDGLFAVNGDWHTVGWSADDGVTWEDPAWLDPFPPDTTVAPDPTVGGLSFPGSTVAPDPNAGGLSFPGSTVAPSPSTSLDVATDSLLEEALDFPVPSVPRLQRVPATGPIGSRRACRGTVCWEVDNGGLVRVDDDGRSTELEAIPNHADVCSGGHGTVTSVETFDRAAGGPILVASMGGQGVATSTGDGTWHRFAPGGTRIPADLASRVAPPWWSVGGAVFVAAMLVLGLTFGRPTPRRLAPVPRRPRGVGASMLLGAVLLGLVGGYMVSAIANGILAFIQVGAGLAIVAFAGIVAFVAGRDLAPDRIAALLPDGPWVPEPPDRPEGREDSAS